MSNNPTETVKDYQNYVDQKSPNSPIFKNCFNNWGVEVLPKHGFFCVTP